METWINAAITGGLTLVGTVIAAIIGYFATVSKMKQVIEKLPDEHKDLSTKSSNEHEKLSNSLFANKELLAKIIANQDKEAAVRQAASKNTVDLVDMAKQAVQDTARLENENKLLEEKVLLVDSEKLFLEDKIRELKTLLSEEREKSKRLTAEIKRLKNPPEKDYEYEL